jgi:hypothetical protein
MINLTKNKKVQKEKKIYPALKMSFKGETL